MGWKVACAASVVVGLLLALLGLEVLAMVLSLGVVIVAVIGLAG